MDGVVRAIYQGRHERWVLDPLWKLMVWNSQSRSWSTNAEQAEKFPGVPTSEEGWIFQSLDEETNEWHHDSRAVVHSFSEEPETPVC